MGGLREKGGEKGGLGRRDFPFPFMPPVQVIGH